mmetsp:Transcript_11959/g.24453  ORF Transcript_11959/g.24453 Transcript_11959/m.24453 type:complete len:589 (+) Transcript_11959:50-1816(+)
MQSRSATVLPCYTIPEAESLDSFKSSHSSFAQKGETEKDKLAAKGVSNLDVELGKIKFGGNTGYFNNHPSKANLLSLADKKLISGKKSLTKVDKMLYSTTTPETPMIINTLLIMDGKVPFEDMKDFMEELAMAHPRLRMTVQNSVWRPTELDLDEIVHYHRCPPGVDWRKYIDKKNLLSRHLDTTSHLWEVHGILTNEDKHVFLVRIHHVIGDGLSLVKMVINLFDAEDKTNSTPFSGMVKPAHSSQNPVDSVNSQTAAVGAANIRKKKKRNVITSFFFVIYVLICSPFIAISVALMRSDPPNAFRKKFQQVEKRFVSARCGTVEEIKQIGKMFRGSINDVMVAILCGALRKYQIHVGGEKSAKDMTLIIPISTRDPNEIGVILDNQVATVFLKIPVAEGDLQTRFKKCKKRMDGMKYGATVPVLIFLIKVVLGQMPSFISRRLQNIFASRATMIFSNVPGPRIVRKIKGKRINQMSGFVPLVGYQQAGVACFSYAGEMHLSMMCNPGVVKEPDKFIDFFLEEIAEYKRLTKIKLSKAGAQDARTITETSSLGRQMTLGVDDMTSSTDSGRIMFRKQSLSLSSGRQIG